MGTFKAGDRIVRRDLIERMMEKFNRQIPYYNVVEHYGLVRRSNTISVHDANNGDDEFVIIKETTGGGE